jgi:hypothetical protein
MDLPILTTSERKLMHRCQQAWWWKYTEGLQPRHENADALWFGIGVHIALAQWYLPGLKRGPHPADTFADWAEDEMREIRTSREEWDILPKYEDAAELGTRMLEGYVDEYGEDPDWYIIQVETPFRIKVNWRGKDVVRFMSAWDLVFRDQADGRIYLGEHKTAAAIATAYLSLDPQAGIYWALASQVLKARKVLTGTERIAGIHYNFLRKTAGDDRPRDEQGRYLNKDGTISKRQPPPAYVREIIERQPSELRSELDMLADDVATMEYMRSGHLPVTKNRTWECPRCEFFTMCQLHQKGGEKWREIAKSSFIRVDPYERYTKSASE